MASSAEGAKGEEDGEEEEDGGGEEEEEEEEDKNDNDNDGIAIIGSLLLFISIDPRKNQRSEILLAYSRN
jgi:TATA-binding protein-associated factor Taf7